MSADSGEYPEVPSTVDVGGETQEVPSADGDAAASPADAAGPGGHTQELPQDAPPPGPAGFRARLLRGLKRHEREREDEQPLLAKLSFARYELKREIGRGGMGAVLEAHDRTLGRGVALKVLLTPELASREAKERFQFEARAAARLEHPNIVGLHEVGDEDGVPYLVMELVEGESLASRLQREGPLAPREVARIGREVAEALYFAHSRALLHHDVKPANVLLDADGRVRLSDFGLAKDVTGEAASVTHSGQALGTPHYMPPEQIRGEKDRVDRRVDVYGLGATLYECLTGRPPFVGQSVGSVLQQVLKDEPAPPGRLREDGLDRDLETVVLTCLEKEPERRYASAQELALDLQRVLDHEPIRARRPGVLDRLRKWTRRNRAVTWALGVSGGVALAVIVAGSLGFMARLREERDRAEAAADEAREAMQALVYEVRDELQDVPGTQVREARLRLLQNAVVRLERLERSDAEGRGMHIARLAALWRQITELALEAGQTDQALLASERSLAYAEPLYGANSELALARTALVGCLAIRGEIETVRGDPAAALPYLERALPLARQDDPPGETLAVVLVQLGTARCQLGDDPQGEALLDEARALREDLLQGNAEDAFAVRSGLAVVHERLSGIAERAGRSEEAREHLRTGVALLRELLRERPESLRTRRSLANGLDRLGIAAREHGDLERALRLSTEGLALRRALWELDRASTKARIRLAGSLINRCDALILARQHREALGLAEEAVSLLRATETDEEVEGRRALATGLEKLGLLRARGGDPEGAVAAQREAVALERGVLATNPASVVQPRHLAIALRRQAELLRSRDGAEARAVIEEAIALLLAARATAPRDVSVVSELAACHLERSRLARDQAQPEAAFASIVFARGVLEELAAIDPADRSVRRRIAYSYVEEAELASARGTPEHAERAWARSLELQRAIVQDSGATASDRSNLCASLLGLGNRRKERGELAEARALISEGVEVMRGVVQVDAEDLKARANLYTLLESLGNVLRREDRQEEAAEAYRQAMDALPERASGQVPERPMLLVFVTTGAGAYARGDYAAAQEAYEQALRVARARHAAEPNLSTTIRDVAVVLTRLGDVSREQGQLERALREREEAVRVIEPLAQAAPERFGSDLDTMRALVEDVRVELALERGGQGLTDPRVALRAAKIAARDQRWVTAAHAYRCVLSDDDLAHDLDAAHLYNGACVASLASAAVDDATEREGWQRQALLWLATDLARRQALVRGVEAQDPSPERDRRLALLRPALALHLERARSGDPDFAPLRELAEFQALFR
ncbi:MAG: protein kinase [Planctomycetota bacterium]